MINLKKRLHDGDSLIGAIVSLDNPNRTQLERVLEKTPYDFFLADSQHNPFAEQDLVSVCQAADELSMPVIFRIMDTR